MGERLIDHDDRMKLAFLAISAALLLVIGAIAAQVAAVLS